MSPKKSQQKDQISPPMKVQPVSQSGTGSVPDAVFLDYDRTLQLLQETLATRGTGRVHEMLTDTRISTVYRIALLTELGMLSNVF